MNSYPSWRMVLPVAALAALLAGCNKQSAQNTQPEPEGPARSFIGGPQAPAQGAVRRGAEIQKAKEHLGAIKLFLAQYKVDRPRGPANLKEFLDFMQRDAPDTAKHLKEDNLTMVFKPGLAPEALLAYVSFEDGAGNRLVLRENGVIEVLNKQAFAEAQKK